jgi:tetratricopeptide (TPR) repeat protein
MICTTSTAQTTRLLFVFCALALGSAGCSKGEPSKDEVLSRANEAVAADQLKKAEDGYREVLSARPDDPVALRNLGILYHEQGEIPQAYPLLKQAAEQQPDDAEVQIKFGSVRLAMGDTAYARDAARQVLESQPANDDAVLLLADSVVEQNDFQEARKLIEELREREPKRAAYHVALGTLDLRERKPAAAEREFKAGLDLDSNSIAAYMGLGVLYSTRNDLTAAGQAFKNAAELSPPRSPARMRYLDFLITTGATDAAKTVLKEITAKYPDYLPPRVAAMKLACTERRNGEDCAARVQDVLGQNPFNHDALVEDARINLTKGDATKATSELEYLSNTYARDARVRYQLALAQLALTNNTTRSNAREALDGAQRRLAEAVKIDPQFEPAVLLLAQLKVRAGDPVPAIGPLKELIKQRPQSARAHSLLASAYLAERQSDEALAVYRTMEQSFPKDPQPPFMIGSILLQQNQPADARKAFEKSVEIAPDYLPATERLVDLDIADKQYAAALRRVQKHIDKDPKAAQAWALRAKIYYAQQDFARAEPDLLKAIELDPKTEPAYMLLTRLYVTSNRADEAIDRLKGFVEKNKDVPALMQLGILYERRKDFDAARQAYEQLLDVNGNFAPALDNLAAIYSEQVGDISKALELAKKAYDVAPNDAKMADTLAWIMFKKGDYAGALQLLSGKADNLKDLPATQFHLGMIHYMLGEEGPARDALKTALDANTDFPGRDEARKRLSLLALDLGSADARREIENYLRQQPNDPAALVRLAALQQRDGNGDQAIMTYEKVIADNPAFAPALRGLAIAYAQQRPSDLAKAFDLAAKARDAYPGDPEVAKALGILSYRRELYPRATELLKEAAAKRKDDAEVLYYIGAVQRALKQWSECRRTLEQAWALKLPARLAGDARQALADCSDTTSRSPP